MKNLKGVSLAVAATAAAVFVPLYAASGRASVSHPEWAHMLLRGLEMEESLPRGATASLAFDFLTWRTSVGIAPAKPFRSTGVQFTEGAPVLVRTAGSIAGEIGYRLAVPRTGDYRVRLTLRNGDQFTAAHGVALELTAAGETTPVKSLTLAASPSTETGAIFLKPALYTLSIGLPPGLSLEAIEVVPPCVIPIEPPGGWQRTAVTQTGDVAVTALKALDLEHELPPAASPIEVPGSAFQPTTEHSLLKASVKTGLEGSWLQAGDDVLQAMAQISVPEPGLYTVYGYGLSGGGQSWVSDSCQKSVLCPSGASNEAPSWKPLLTSEFSAGRHSFGVALARLATVHSLKLERKKASVADYVATLARLGFDVGAQAPITRARATEAMEFIRAKRKQLAATRCGVDVVLPSAGGVLVAGLSVTPGATSFPGTVVPPAAGGPVPFVPLPGPSTPGPGATPTPAASTTPGSPAPPSPSPSPTPSPSPSIGPPPTTVVQPPASPVKE
jgi:hypothetical protein